VEVRSETRDAWGRGPVMAVSNLDLGGGATSLSLSLGDGADQGGRPARWIRLGLGGRGDDSAIWGEES
jgi:hypothetical protein